MKYPTFLILGCPIHALNLASAATRLIDLRDGEEKGYIIFRDVHGVVRCQDNPEFLKAHQNAEMVCPDGMPIVWIGRRKGFSEMGRVYGPDMMRELMNATRDGSATHFLYGGNEGVADTLKDKLETQFPGVQIVGCECPPFGPLTPEFKHTLQERISNLKPDFFWVGLSTPKQEFFMQEYINMLDTKVMLGVGAAFDYLSGTVKEPPRWIQRSGFQWLYRICSEPRRLLGRYFRTIPRFIWLIIKEKIALNGRHTD